MIQHALLLGEIINFCYTGRQLSVCVCTPSESFQPPSTAGDVSGEPGQEGTVMGDQDGEPGTLGHHRLNPLIRHIRHAVTDVELLQ